MSFTQNFIKSRKVDEGTFFASNQLKPPKFYVNTGSYSVNGLLSGSIMKGMPSNSILAFAGEPATGKTFFALNIVKEMLESNPDAEVVYFESEKAIKEGMLAARGIDENRLFICEVVTVQDFRTRAAQMLEDYAKIPEDKRPPLMFVLDSLGNLSTTKEIEDTTDGKETKDMTRAQLNKATFRVLTLKAGQLNVPIIVTNHTYDEMGPFGKRVMGGGSGLKYCASTVFFLSKRKEKVGDEVVGNVIHVKADKSRDTREGLMVDTLLNYETGLDPYHGLIEIAEEAKIFNKVGNKYEIVDETTGEIQKVFESAIKKNPQKYFTSATLNKIDEYVQKEFKYGTAGKPVETEDDEFVTEEE